MEIRQKSSEVWLKKPLLIYYALTRKKSIQMRIKISKKWRLEKKANISENIISAYFTKLSSQYKASSLWNKYSLLKATIKIHDNIGISSYTKVILFLKRQSEGCILKNRKFYPRKNLGNF